MNKTFAEYAAQRERIRAAAEQAWAEGWAAGNRWAFTEADDDLIDHNPYREQP